MMGGAGAIREVPGGDSGPEGVGTWAGGGLSENIVSMVHNPADSAGFRRILDAPGNPAH